jgi:hypothetical protein
MKTLNLFLIAVVLTACATQQQAPSPIPTPSVSPSPSPSPGPTPSPTPTPIVGGTLKELTAAAESHACAKISWGNSIKLSTCGKPGYPESHCYTSLRGRMPTGATAGIAVNYARALCNKDAPWVKAVSKATLGAPERDQLAYMAAVLKSAGIPTGSESDNLRAVYASMFSFAAMESSGKACEGKDSGADNDNGDTTEAGMFQTSWNASPTHSELVPMFNAYKRGERPCLTAVYGNSMGGCKSADAINYGVGTAKEFQALSKRCPSMTTEFAAIMFRHGRSHYYPLNQAGKPERASQKWIEPHASCVSLLKQVESMVSPGLCAALK